MKNKVCFLIGLLLNSFTRFKLDALINICHQLTIRKQLFMCLPFADNHSNTFEWIFDFHSSFSFPNGVRKSWKLREKRSNRKEWSSGKWKWLPKVVQLPNAPESPSTHLSCLIPPLGIVSIRIRYSHSNTGIRQLALPAAKNAICFKPSYRNALSNCVTRAAEKEKEKSSEIFQRSGKNQRGCSRRGSNSQPRHRPRTVV